MKQLTENPERNRSMKRKNQKMKTPRRRRGTPLYASAWVALFVMLRNEIMLARAGNE